MFCDVPSNPHPKNIKYGNRIKNTLQYYTVCSTLPYRTLLNTHIP